MSVLYFSHSCWTDTQGNPAVFTLSIPATSNMCVYACYFLHFHTHQFPCLHCQDDAVSSCWYLNCLVSFTCSCIFRTLQPKQLALLPLPKFHVSTSVFCCNSLSNFCIIADDNMCVIKRATNNDSGCRSCSPVYVCSPYFHLHPMLT